MQFTKVPATAFENIQINAGIIVDAFTPSSGVIGNILGVTSGGITFASNPSYTDFGADMDNVPANTYQLKKIIGYDPTASGTFVSVTPALAKLLNGGATSTTETGGEVKIAPASQLSAADFDDVWIVGDYSDVNDGATTAGYIAVHTMNAMNTAGFRWTTDKNAKGQFGFEFHGHYDLTDIDTVPYEVYVKTGTSGE